MVEMGEAHCKYRKDDKANTNLVQKTGREETGRQGTDKCKAARMHITKANREMEIQFFFFFIGIWSL